MAVSVAVGASAAMALTGCSGGSSASQADSKALEQIKLAAHTTQSVRTLTAKLSVHSVGARTGGLTGTIAMQMKPTTLIEAQFDVPATTSPGTTWTRY